MFRVGGDEFVALSAAPLEELVTALSGATSPSRGHRDLAPGAGLAERLRSAVEALRLPHGAPGRPYVTVSIGVATAGPDHTVVEAVERAARRAYWLKNNERRNDVRASGDE